MSELLIRNVKLSDLDQCFVVESAGFPEEEAASRESIRIRVETFPQGFLVAELDGRIIGMINSASTNKDDISDEELKKMVGHDTDGQNLVVFSLVVLPEYQKQGIARQLMLRFIEEADRLGKKKILLMCKNNLIEYYERMGFSHIGLSSSTHGGAEWHEMGYLLQG
jgi:ribosomal protein S18 acetylase RimI-like enzyme